MPTTFDEVLLDVSYSADAEGGPEFASVIIRSGEGGAVALRNANREDFVSRYEIEFGEVSPDRRRQLRTFAVLRNGMTRGFRFLAPDDHELVNEFFGWLNPATGEVEVKLQCDGTTAEFFLIQYLTDQANAYSKRIIKPSPFADVVIDVYEASDPNTIFGSGTIAANSALGAFNVINETIAGSVFAPGAYNFTFNFHQGKIVWEVPPSADWIIKITCDYHVPVAFSQDWHKFSIDESNVSGFKVVLEEILPVELGII